MPIVVPLQLEDSHGVILIKAVVNGNPASLLLDTGATSTILTPRILGLRPADMRQARFTSDSPGISGNGAWVRAHLKLGEYEWNNRRVFAMGLDTVSQTLSRRIDGILGQDLLAQFQRITIDFKSQRLVLER